MAAAIATAVYQATGKRVRGPPTTPDKLLEPARAASVKGPALPPPRQQNTSTRRKYGGTGLGPTITARLAMPIGGQISVESQPGRVSTFAFAA